MPSRNGWKKSRLPLGNAGSYVKTPMIRLYREARRRATGSAAYPVSAMTRNTRSRVSGAMRTSASVRLLSTSDTVA